MGYDFPFLLNEGRTFDVWYTIEGIREGLRQNIGSTIDYAWFEDDIERRYKAKIPKHIEQVIYETR